MPQRERSRVYRPTNKLVPLCVDLDGTLIRTDILWESLAQLWRHPHIAARALLALLLRGKAELKTVLANALSIDAAHLPYREEVLNLIRSQNKLGRDVILATASHRIVAQCIADHLGLFCGIFATDRGLNLSGTRKQAALESTYGRYGFDYIGDSEKDLPVFAAAREAILVNPSRQLLRRATNSGNVSRVFAEEKMTIRLIARALRLHQWTKNFLVAVPLLAAQLVLKFDAWLHVGIAFFAFSLVASATYLINDLVDLQADRVHPKKRFRPLASGQLPIRTGVILAIATGSLGLFLSMFLPTRFVAYIGAYVALTLAYSFDFKRRLLLDVLALALLYTLRILAGGAAIGVRVSEWLLMFSLFMFFSLAFLKRAIELEGTEGQGRVPGRGYSREDLETIRVVGVSSGFLSVLVFSLYIGTPTVSQMYRSPQFLWLICPLLIYWVARIWFMAARGEVHHDPIVFALLDWRSHVIAAFTVLFVLLAKFASPWVHW